jgi:environmental stress-induced protein Ves
MTRATLLRPEDYRVMPWRNGQGSTTEIAVSPGRDGRFRWRFSIADVAASGPFSDFSGYVRIIAVASGTGMRLAVAGREPVTLTPHTAPYEFPGEAATECTLLDGPIRDVNLMIDRETMRGALTALHFAGSPIAPPPISGTALLHAVRGGLAVDAGPAGRWTMPVGATLRLDDAAGEVRIDGESAGYALWATVKDVPAP